MQLTRSHFAVAAVAAALLLAGCGSGGGSTGAGKSPGGGQSSGSSGGGQSAIVGSASAPITKTTVTVGSVATLSGPFPGLFQGAPYGVDAYFSMVNANGGVNGRKLQLVSGDDALSCNQNGKVTEQLATSVFAFVGNYSVFDSCGAKAIAAQPTLADISTALSNNVKALPNFYSAQPQPPGSGLGPYTYLKNTSGATKVGALYGLASATTQFQQQAEALKSIGYKIVYQRQVGLTETSFTSDVIRMRSEGVNFLDLTDLPVANVVQVLRSAKQQNWNPKVTIAATAYDAKFFKLLGDPSAAEGLLIPEASALFLGQDKAQNPAVAKFLTWMSKVHPDFQPDIFSLSGWVSAELFVQALQAAGPDPTPAMVVAKLGTIHSFTAGGLLPPNDVGNKKPTQCWLLAAVKDGKYVRVTPDKGFRCVPGGYYDAKG